jgi:hypothetical protein
MDKKETEELNKLSLECFGKKYEWRKLRKKGLVIGHDKETGYIRRTPLTAKQAKDYMVKTLEMREATLKDMEETANESR